MYFFFSKINIQRQIHTQLVIQGGGGSFINQIKLDDENKTNISSEYRDWSRLPFLFCFNIKHQINNHL